MDDNSTKLHKKKVDFLKRAALEISTRVATDPIWLYGVTYHPEDVTRFMRKMGLRYKVEEEERLIDKLQEYVRLETNKYNVLAGIPKPQPCPMAEPAGCKGYIIYPKRAVPRCSVGGFAHYLASRLKLDNIPEWLEKAKALHTVEEIKEQENEKGI